VHEISAAEVLDLFPLARVDDVLAGFYVAEDGRANPVDVTMALAKGARLKGATILEGVPVTGVTKARGTVTGVRVRGPAPPRQRGQWRVRDTRGPRDDYG